MCSQQNEHGENMTITKTHRYKCGFKWGGGGSCCLCTASLAALRRRWRECTVCPYMYSALNHKWQLGPAVPSYCPQRTQFTTAARALSYSCADTNHPRSPETVRLAGVTGMGYVAIVFWICCWANGIFLRSVSGFSGKTGQPSAGNLWSLGDSDLLA